LSDGSEFDNSRAREEPLSATVGSGQLIKGFDDALVGMSLNETKTVTLSPDMAYGKVFEEGFQTVSREKFPDEIEFGVGNIISGHNASGQPFMAKVLEITDESVRLDLNHPLAGKELTFEIEVVEIL
jgi:peptidylprolyl isomerase